MLVAASSSFLLLFSFALGCSGTAEKAGSTDPARVSISDGWLSMGTFFEADLRVESHAVDAARAWLAGIRVRCEEFEAVLSRHSPESEVSRLNRTLLVASPAELDAGIAIGSDLAEILRDSRRIHERTGGAFDVTIGPLVALWTSASRAGRFPSESQMQRARARVGGAFLEISETGLLHAKRSAMVLDLDAVSKGFVLDRLASDFREAFPSGAALLSFGQSSVAAIGDPDGRGWRLRLRSRSPARGFVGELRLRDAMLSVSSSLGATSEIAGQIVSHVLDPATGRPVAGTREAVVIGPSAVMADGFSTALLVRAADARLLEEMRSRGFEAWVSSDDGATTTSEGS